jgi:formate/nitrite transporter FocA (FNT family)
MTHDGKPTDLATTAEHPGVDALLPSEIAAKAENVGAKKVRLDPVRLLALAVLAGAFIALGAMFATTVLAGASTMPFGMSRLVAGLVFSLGLILVVVGTLMVMALAARKITVREMLRAWASSMRAILSARSAPPSWSSFPDSTSWPRGKSPR